MIIVLLGLVREIFHQTLGSWPCLAERCCFESKTHTVQTDRCALLFVISFFPPPDKGKKDKPDIQEDKLRMEVRYNQETEGMVLKNGLKEGKDSKDSQGSLSKSFLKEQQDSFSPSGTLDNCEKNRGSTGDPDYCRRILVRGEASSFICSVCVFWTNLSGL